MINDPARRPTTACSRAPRSSAVTTSSARAGRTRRSLPDNGSDRRSGCDHLRRSRHARRRHHRRQARRGPGREAVRLKVCSAPATSCSGVALLQGMDCARRPERRRRHRATTSTSSTCRWAPSTASRSTTTCRPRSTLPATPACSRSRRPATAPTSSSSPVRRRAASAALSRRADRGAVGLAATHDAAGAGHGQPRRGVPAVVRAADHDHRRSGVLSRADGSASASAAPMRRAPPRTRPVSSRAASCSSIVAPARSASRSRTSRRRAASLGIIGLDHRGCAVRRRLWRRRADDPGLHDQPGRREHPACGQRASCASRRRGTLSLAGSLASTSSRGPRFDDNIVKPEIGAPGASISAMSGSFTGTAAFGGTSGAAPMVTGAAAILHGSARPYLSASARSSRC